MGTDPVVDRLIDDGERLLQRLADDGVPVEEAYLTRSDGRDRWVLKLVTPLADAGGRAVAYRAILPVMRSLDDLWLTSSDVYAVGTDDPDRLPTPDRDGWWPPGPSLFDEEPRSRFVFPRLRPSRPHVHLTPDQKQLLEDLYLQSPLTLDELPYTGEMDRLHQHFVAQSGSPLAVRDVYRALMNLRRQGRLARKRRHAPPAESVAAPA